jgi:hypothetical protein
VASDRSASMALHKLAAFNILLEDRMKEHRAGLISDCSMHGLDRLSILTYSIRCFLWIPCYRRLHNHCNLKGTCGSPISRTAVRGRTIAQVLVTATRSYKVQHVHRLCYFKCLVLSYLAVLRLTSISLISFVSHEIPFLRSDLSHKLHFSFCTEYPLWQRKLRCNNHSQPERPYSNHRIRGPCPADSNNASSVPRYGILSTQQ